MKIILILLMPLGLSLSAILFDRKLSTADPSFGQLFTPMSSTSTRSALECGAWLMTTTTRSAKASRASAFAWYTDNLTCVLGRAPAYADRYISSSGGPEDQNRARLIAGIPTAAAMNSDTWFYALLNDEKSEYYSHPSFIGAWPSGFTPNWSGFTYSITSPVTTYGGTYATSLNGNFFKYSAATSTNFQEITILLWYYSPSDTPNGECIVSLCYGGSSKALSFFASNSQRIYIATNANSWYIFSANGIRTLGAWNYLGVTFSKVSQRYAFWVNGTITGYYDATTASSIPTFDTVNIGADCDTSYAVMATLASVEIYSRELNQTEIQAAMAKSYTGRTMTGVLPP